MNKYKLPLKAFDIDNNQVIAKITRTSATNCTMQIRHLDVVEKDDPKFAIKGSILIQYLQKNHLEVVGKITDYLNKLFLNELSEAINENNDTKHGVRSGTGRVAGQSDSGAKGKGERKRPGGVHGSGGRAKQAEGDRPRAQDANMAKGSNPKDSGNTEGRDEAI